MMSLDALLDGIVKRPGMYVGNYSLERIAAYIDGFRQCARENVAGWEDDVDDFQEYVRQYYGNETHNWAMLIGFYEGLSEKVLFDAFVKRLQEFREKRAKKQLSN